MQGPRRDTSMGGQLAQIWGLLGKARGSHLTSSEEATIAVAPNTLIHTKVLGPALSQHPLPSVGSSCLQWLPVSGWIGWGGIEFGESGCPFVMRGPVASLGFPLRCSFLPMGAEWSGYQNWTWAPWPAFDRSYSWLPQQPTYSLAPEAWPDSEMGETWRK